MKVGFAKGIITAIVEEAGGSRDEICGLLLGAPARVTASLRCVNVSPDPARGFELSPAQLLAAHRAARSGGPGIVGCYHSHPAGPPIPSARDAAAAAPDGMLWLIAADSGVGVWRAVAAGTCEGRFEAVDHHELD